MVKYLVAQCPGKPPGFTPEAHKSAALQLALGFGYWHKVNNGDHHVLTLRCQFGISKVLLNKTFVLRFFWGAASRQTQSDIQGLHVGKFLAAGIQAQFRQTLAAGTDHALVTAHRLVEGLVSLDKSGSNVQEVIGKFGDTTVQLFSCVRNCACVLGLRELLPTDTDRSKQCDERCRRGEHYSIVGSPNDQVTVTL